MSKPEENTPFEAVSKIPNTNALDHATTAAKIAVGLLPLVGSTLSEILNKTATTIVNARTEEWYIAVVKTFEDLYDKVDNSTLPSPEVLFENEKFITALLTATQATAKTHQKEKKEALRNAVINSALPDSPDDDLQLMFLNSINVLTPSHLKLLKFVTDPTKWATEHSISFRDLAAGSFKDVIDTAFPELARRPEFRDRLAKDLTDLGLANLDVGSYAAISSGRSLFATRITEMGKTFLQFITLPFEEGK